MIITTEILEALEELEPTTKNAFIKVLRGIEKSVGEAVKKEDFNNLNRTVAELAEAQKQGAQEMAELRAIVGQLAEAQQRLTEAQQRTEQRLEALAEAQQRTEQKLEELAKAQQRTEQRLEALAEAQQRTEQRLEELAEAQQKTEQRLEELAEAQQKLAEAQQRTEQRLEELAEAQQRTEQRLEELTEAQKKTEKGLQELSKEVKTLTEEHKKTREQLGGLAHTFGYYLENEAHKYLPKILQERYSFTLEGDLRRTFIEISSNVYEEIDIFGFARKDNERYVILGECKTQLKKRDIDRFLERVERIKRFFTEKPFVIFVTHQVTVSVIKYVDSLGFPVFYSYEFR